MLRKFGRQNDRSPEAGCKLFKPRRQVYGRAYAGKIQPVITANIAVEHFAEMERQTKAHATHIAESGGCLDGIDVVLCLACRGERAIAHFASVRRAPGQRKDRQQSVGTYNLCLRWTLNGSLSSYAIFLRMANDGVGWLV